MRTGKVAFLALIMSLALVLSACESDGGQPIELTGEDSGSDVTLSVGQEMRVTLESNPTTGYRWDVDGGLPPQLEPVGEAEYAAESTALGAGGTEVWVFKGASVGEGTLRMKYWRSFEPDATPPEEFEITVTVE